MTHLKAAAPRTQHRLGERGFSITEQLIVAVIGAFFIILFVQGSILLSDRFFSISRIADFDESRRTLRLQASFWRNASFNREIYLSQEILNRYGLPGLIPAPGLSGSGFVLEDYVVGETGIEPQADSDMVVMLVRNSAVDPLMIMVDSSTPAYADFPGVYKIASPSPYVYVAGDLSPYKVGDLVALTSMSGVVFGQISVITGNRVELDFSGMGEFRPLHPYPHIPFDVIYQGGTLQPVRMAFVGADKKKQLLRIGWLTENPAQRLIVANDVTVPVNQIQFTRSTPGSGNKSFIPFQTSQQLSVNMLVPTFVGSLLADKETQQNAKSPMTFLVPL